MKIFIAQQNYHIGNFEKNTQKILGAISEAKLKKADLIVFSELSVCGYPAKDYLYSSAFIDQCYKSIDTIKEHADNIGVIIGSPARNPKKEGRPLYNAAFFLHEKEIKNIIYKTCLPTYDVFDEARYFEPGSEWQVISFQGKRIALTICEDIWNLGNHPLYPICPMDILMKDKPEVMINISASPFDYTHVDDRKATIKSNVSKYGLPLIYCNSIGSQSEIIFDGSSLVFDKNAHLVCQLPQFEEALMEIILKPDGTFNSKTIEPAEALPNQQSEPEELMPELNIGQVHDAIILGIRDYFSKMGFKKAILGSSGGLDSAVSIALACEALGKENVLAVLMPSEYSTDHSITDAENLSKNLENPYQIIPIKSIYKEFLKELKPLFKDSPFNVAEENIQARSRGVLLMAIANKWGHILLNTSNKSE
ncbi:MAG: NAD(+) synthase, partial [Ginsengibacter sp.]